MNRYEYNGNFLTIAELSEISGIRCHTLRDRLRRGFTVEQAIRPVPMLDSVDKFCDHSWYRDWIGMSISDLYAIYWKWCIQNGYTATSKQGFSRQLKSRYPQLKTIPTQKGDTCERIIRLRR